MPLALIICCLRLRQPVIVIIIIGPVYLIPLARYTREDKIREQQFAAV
jgi:hypothetical protein